MPQTVIVKPARIPDRRNKEADDDERRGEPRRERSPAPTARDLTHPRPPECSQLAAGEGAPECKNALADSPRPMRSYRGYRLPFAPLGGPAAERPAPPVISFSKTSNMR
jgi:hypothetical protein